MVQSVLHHEEALDNALFEADVSHNCYKEPHCADLGLGLPNKYLFYLELCVLDEEIAENDCGAPDDEG